MKTIKQQDIAEKAGISQSMLSQLLSGHRRAGWRTAKRLSSVVIGSTSKQWLEAPPETLRQIVSEYQAQQTMVPPSAEFSAQQESTSA